MTIIITLITLFILVTLIEKFFVNDYTTTNTPTEFSIETTLKQTIPRIIMNCLIALILSAALYKFRSENFLINISGVLFLLLIIWLIFKSTKSLVEGHYLKINKKQKSIDIPTRQIHFEEIKSLELFECLSDSETPESYEINIFINKKKKIYLFNFNNEKEAIQN